MKLTLALLVFLTACSATKVAPAFVNRTSMPDSQFQATAQADWKQAQTALATQPINLAAGVGGVKDVPPDTRAYGIAPIGITVEAQQDAPGHPGLITCSSYTGYCYAYLANRTTIVVPASHPAYMGPYEMENIILWELGYDVSER